KQEQFKKFLLGALLGVAAGHLAWNVGLVVGDRVSPATLDVIGLFGGVVLAAVGWETVLIVVNALLLVASLTVAFTPLAAALASGWVRNASRVDSVDAVVALSAS